MDAVSLLIPSEVCKAAEEFQRQLEIRFRLSASDSISSGSDSGSDSISSGRSRLESRRGGRRLSPTPFESALEPWRHAQVMKYVTQSYITSR
jgi:hypothetical protein